MRRVAAAAAVAVCAAVALAACTGPGSRDPQPTATRASGSPVASPSPSASGPPALVYTGTARQNLPYFDMVNQRLIAAGGSPRGRDFIDSLVTAGFVKADMQVTPDTTSVGLAADNIQFSVLFNGNCLIGQYGNIGYARTVQPVLATGRCLVGRTRAIDW
ncbi:MAG: hypothetical protein HY996_08290 [Micrococcales bacterium]|nr:hypothetical protein [Micrococcales bacterium]